MSSSLQLLMNCFPTMTTSSWMKRSTMQPDGSHCKTKHKAEHVPPVWMCTVASKVPSKTKFWTTTKYLSSITHCLRWMLRCDTTIVSESESHKFGTHFILPVFSEHVSLGGSWTSDESGKGKNNFFADHSSTKAFLRHRKIIFR